MFINKKFIIITFLIFLSLIIYYFSHHSVILSPGGMEQAEIARNLSEGKGFKTNILMPFKINLNKEVLYYPTKEGLLQPLVIYFLSSIFGITDRTVILTSLIFFLAILPVIYLITKEIFNKNVAIISVLIFAFNLSSIKWASYGSPEYIFFFLFLLSIYFLIKKNIILAGVVFGLAQLARQYTCFYLLPFLIYIYLIYENKLINILKFCITFFIITSISLIHNYVNTSNVFIPQIGNYLAFFTPVYPGHTALRITEIINPIEFILSSYPQILSKIKLSIYNFIEFFPLLSNPYLMAFFIVSIFFHYEDKKENNFRLFTYLLIIFALFFHSITTSYRDRYFFHLLPLIIIIAANLLCIIIDNLKNKFVRVTSIILIIFLLIFPLINDLHNIYHKKDSLTNEVEFRNKIKELILRNTTENDIIISDAPFIVSWYTKRQCFLLPYSIADLENLTNKFNVKGLILSSNYVYYLEYDAPNLWLAKYIEPKKENVWTNIFESKIKLKNFKLKDQIRFNDSKILLFEYIKKSRK